MRAFRCSCIRIPTAFLRHSCTEAPTARLAGLGTNLHVGGAAHDVEFGVVNGTPTCQFTLTTTMWNGLGDAPTSMARTTEKGTGSKWAASPVVPPVKVVSMSTLSHVSAKEQFTVRCTGSSEIFAQQLAGVLQNGMVLEVQGELRLHSEELRKGLHKQHAAIQITQEGLRSLRHSLVVLHCGPHQCVNVVQGQITGVVFAAESSQ
eukprot:gene10153-biopygen7316